jgi:hypothetical protein
MEASAACALVIPQIAVSVMLILESNEGFIAIPLLN